MIPNAGRDTWTEQPSCAGTREQAGEDLKPAYLLAIPMCSVHIPQNVSHRSLGGHAHRWPLQQDLC